MLLLVIEFKDSEPLTSVFRFNILFLSWLMLVLTQETTCLVLQKDKHKELLVKTFHLGSVPIFPLRGLGNFFPFINLHLWSTLQKDGAVVAQWGQRYTALCM